MTKMKGPGLRSAILKCKGLEKDSIEVTAHSIGKEHGSLPELVLKDALAPGFAEKRWK